MLHTALTGAKVSITIVLRDGSVCLPSCWLPGHKIMSVSFMRKLRTLDRTLSKVGHCRVDTFVSRRLLKAPYADFQQLSILTDHFYGDCLRYLTPAGRDQHRIFRAIQDHGVLIQGLMPSTSLYTEDG